MDSKPKKKLGPLYYSIIPFPLVISFIIGWSYFDLSNPPSKEYGIGAALSFIFYYLPIAIIAFSLFSSYIFYSLKLTSKNKSHLFLSILLHTILYIILFTYPLLLSPIFRNLYFNSL